MSFSSDTKDELCTLHISGCCKAAECYGLLLYSRCFSFSEISLRTANPNVVRLFSRRLQGVTGVVPVVKESGEVKKNYTAAVLSQNDRAQILHFFGYSGGETTHCLHPQWLQKDCCVAAFLRGAFLACGTVSDPNKAYQLEFVVGDPLAAEELLALLQGLSLSPRSSRRGKQQVVYFRGSGQIEDLLTRMGSAEKSMEIMEVEVMNSVRNRANRRSNFEVANIEKTALASSPQVKAVQYLRDNDMLDDLPEELREVALLRLLNPELSLRELSMLLSGKLSRSGLNYRLQKLVEIVETARSTET